MVTIIVSAGGASEQMLRTCLRSLDKYENETSFKILLAAPLHQSEIASKVAKEMRLDMFSSKEREDDISGSRIHASVLDKAVQTIETPYLLTLDADCFPMVDGWLDWMMGEIKGGAAVTGISQPYVPPPKDLKETTLEYRIRSQLCWSNTHVACQLVGMETLKRLGVGFSDGDDTGLAIPSEARKAGMTVTSLKLTSCAWPEGESPMDPEFNRSYCLIYQDMIYHHGGGSRENQGQDLWYVSWDKVRKRVVDEGTEFLSKTDTYSYQNDREEDVADHMAKGVLRGMSFYLQTNDRLFEE